MDDGVHGSENWAGCDVRYSDEVDEKPEENPVESSRRRRFSREHWIAMHGTFCRAMEVAIPDKNAQGFSRRTLER
jgi:hypothetical protein